MRIKLYYFAFVCFIVNLPLSAQIGSNCDTPLVISNLPYNQLDMTTCGFGNDYGSGGCNNGNYMQGEDFVMEFTPTISSCYNLQLYGINGGNGADLALFVFEGCPSSNNCLDSDNENNSNEAFIKIDLVAGTTYYIVVGSENSPNGPDCGTFDFLLSDPLSAPVNDFCENAIPLGGLGSNYNATACNEPNEWTPNELGYDCDGENQWSYNHNGVWYVFSNDQQQDVTIDVFNIECLGVIGQSLLQIGVWSNTGTCDLGQEEFYGCLVTTGDAELFLNNLPAGDYYLYADGSAGSLCTWGFASEEVITCTPPVLQALSNTNIALCADNTLPVTLSIDTIGGTQPQTVAWLENGLPYANNALSINVLATETTVYTAVVTNDCGSSSQVFSLIFDIAPTAAISGNGMLCVGGNDSTLVQIALNGVPPFTFQYAIDGSAQPSVSNFMGSTYSFYAHEIGTYTLLSFDDAGSCGANISGTATIDPMPLPPAPELPDWVSYCLGNTASPFVLTPPMVGVSVSWYAENPEINTNTPVLSNSFSFDWGNFMSPIMADTLVFWAVYTLSGCSGPANSLTAISYLPPALPDVADMEYCAGEPIPPFTTQDNAVVYWYANAFTDIPLSVGNTFTPPYAGVFYIAAQDGITGCYSSRQPVSLTQVPPVNADFSYAESYICQLDTLLMPTISGQTGGIFSAFPAGLSIDSLSGVINVGESLAGEVYNISYTVSNGVCSESETALLQIGAINASLPDTLFIEQGDTAVLMCETNYLGSGVLSYSWTTSEGILLGVNSSPLLAVSPADSTLYQVTVDNGSGCAATAQTLVVVLLPEPIDTTTGGNDTTIIPPPVVPPAYTVVLPNAFSPNGDGMNDLFRMTATNVAAAEIIIYNRWGQQIHAEKGAAWAWDGRFRGMDSEVGTYVYSLSVTYDNGQQELFKGYVILIR